MSSSSLSENDGDSMLQRTLSTTSTITIDRLNASNEPISSQSSATTNLIEIEDDETDESQDDADDRPTKKQKLDDTVDDEGSTCVICYDMWDQTGDHRISSLKCGHLFGHKCILRWFAENKVCPTCKAKANRKDIRFIYANKLLAMDTGELTRLQAELTEAKAENLNLQTELTSVLCKMAMLKSDLEKCYFQINELRRMPLTQNTKEVEKSYILQYVDNFLVCPQGSSRVMDCIPSKTSIVASMKSGNNLFPGFGVKHFNSDTFLSLSYTPLHTKGIRDLRFNQSNARLLSVSLDKHFGIANIFSSETNLKQACDDMLWSCCWDATNPNIFYIGGQQGSVKIYDSRYVSNQPVSTHSVEGDMSPVVSIVSIPAVAGSAMPLGGFIACKLNSIWAFERVGGEMRPSALSSEGPFVSMSYNEEDKLLLISARPNARETFARNFICNLTKSDSVLTCNRIHTISNGKMQKTLARSCFIQEGECSFVATPNDSTVQLWNSRTGFPMTVGRTSGAILDLLPLRNSSGTHLLGLSEKKLNVFKLVDS